MLGAVKAIGFFPNSDHFLIFVTLSLLGFTMLTFTFLQLAILGKGGTNDPEKAKQTAQGGSFFSTLLIGLFALLFFTDASSVAWTLCCFFGHVAGPAGIAAGRTRRRPCVTAPPHLPAWWLQGAEAAPTHPRAQLEARGSLPWP